MKTLNSPHLFDIFSKKKVNQKEDELKEKITIDYREKNSLVASHLKRLGFEIEFKELKIGDYIVKDVIIERKTVQDFLSSMINHRLINQIEELKQYENKLLIIEGISDFELYSDDNEGINSSVISPEAIRNYPSEFRGKSKKTRGFSSNAIRGFLLSILLKHKIPVIFSKNSEDTAKFINVLSKKKEKEINLNAKKKTLSKKEQLQFIIEGFPGVGPKKARKLLEKFGNIQNIILAPTEELEKVLGKQAKIIREIMERKY
jgi:ERCC4-type nuclease